MVYEGNYKLGDLFRSRREKGVPGLPTVSVTMSNGLVDRESLEKKTDTNLADEEHLLVKKGDIAYNMMRMWQGAAGLAERDGIVSPAYVVLEPKKNIDSKYAAYLFKSRRLIYLFWAYSYGLTADRLRLYFADFARIPVNIPDIKDQIKIAKILSAWDRSIESVEQLLANCVLQKRSLMQKLLLGNDRLPGFNGKSTEVSLGNLFTERCEPGHESLQLLSITREDGVIARDDTGRKDTSSTDKSKYLRICPGDIGYNTMRMWQGISALSSKEGIVSPAYTIITPKERVSGRFMAHLFKHPRVIHDFFRYSQGLVSDTWNLKYRHFREIRVLLPSLKEQERIADVLDAASAQVRLLTAYRDQLITEKTALMQQLLNGNRHATPVSIA